MDRFGIALIMWFHGLMSTQAQHADFDSVQRTLGSAAALAGGRAVKVIHYDAAANRVIIIHEAPRPAPRVLRFASPLGGR